MKTILATKQIETGAKSYIVDLLTNEKSSYWVEIIQNQEALENCSRIIIDQNVLSETIKTLQDFYSKLELVFKNDKVHVGVTEKNRIIQYYLKGVSIKNLALQFGVPSLLIEQILRNNDIPIVNHSRPKFRPKKR